MSVITRRALVASTVATASLLASAGAAMAQETDATTRSSVSRTTVARTTPTLDPARLESAKTAAIATIDPRLTQLSVISTNMSTNAGDCGTEATLASQFASDSSGLTSLKSQISAATTASDVSTLARKVFGDYRVYALQTPKAYTASTCGLVTTGTDAVDAAAVALTEIANAKSALGVDVSAATAAITSAQSQSASARSTALGTNSTASLSADKGDESVAASNKAALGAARVQLAEARSQLSAARQSLKQASDALKRQ
jgi:hypothetical protein